MINYGRQNINSKDIKNVIKTLGSNWLTSGPEISKFESKISKFTGVKYSVAVNSATSALHLACISLGLQKNDELWTSTNTFVASANCGLHCGANIKLIDIDYENYNIDINLLEKKLIIAKKKKKLPKVIIPVHFAGLPCDMKKINDLSKKYGFKIVEDASHALGAKYLKNKIGSCKYSDITVFSFHPVKMITTGEGGIVTTNDKKIYEKIASLRDHGIDRENFKSKIKPWFFSQTNLGYNYRMTDIQASLGISQMDRLNEFVLERNKIAEFYDNELKNLPLKLPKISKNYLSTYHLYVVQVLDKRIKKNRDNLIKFLFKKGVRCTVHYIPIYKHKFFKKILPKNIKYDQNELYFRRAVSLPIYPGIKKKDLNKVVSMIKQFFN